VPIKFKCSIALGAGVFNMHWVFPASFVDSSPWRNLFSPHEVGEAMYQETFTPTTYATYVTYASANTRHRDIRLTRQAIRRHKAKMSIMRAPAISEEYQKDKL
jgi:hypothetical protein